MACGVASDNGLDNGLKHRQWVSSVRIQPTKNQIFKLVGTTGFEPATSSVSRKRSNQLSYAPVRVNAGIAGRYRGFGDARGASTRQKPQPAWIQSNRIATQREAMVERMTAMLYHLIELSTQEPGSRFTRPRSRLSRAAHPDQAAQWRLCRSSRITCPDEERIRPSH
jgi:hypothetical protein